MNRWCEDVARWPVRDVASALGLAEVRGTWSPCPACGAEQRGSHEQRGPVGLTRNGAGWRCHRCRAGGDGLTLLAIALTGAAKPGPDGWRRVRAFAADRRWCSADGDGPAPKPLRVPPPRPSTPPPPKRPPHDELARLWDGCGPVTRDEQVSGWLASRGLDPTTVERLDLVRALPGAALPSWAGTRRGSWTASGHRAILPMFDHTGRMASVRARCVVPLEPGGLKALAPSGYEVVGLVLADPLARAMLEGAAGALELVRDVGLVVAEGDPDYLSWCARWGAVLPEDAPAVVGLVSGAWTDEVAARVPDGTTVVVRTHLDAAGDRYAEQIVNTLVSRCALRRLQEANT